MSGGERGGDEALTDDDDDEASSLKLMRVQQERSAFLPPSKTLLRFSGVTVDSFANKSFCSGRRKSG
ncbi:unnamed protein product [Linum trigynum]|uniref:Uncharacterized protein n=1 Tax=Linum trigynum TaxID=586398 RepID=A0AAV2G2H5_9ROSI